MYYFINEDKTYVAEHLVEENRFITKEKETEPIPDYREVKALLPELVWDGHEDTIAVYNRAWELAFPFINTLDNFYARQHRDGYIRRAIGEKECVDRFHRHDCRDHRKGRIYI